MSLIEELKRRNVLRVGAAYIVFAWLVVQVVATIFPSFGFSDAAIRNVTIGLAVGLVPVVIFAWVFELTPQGLKKEIDPVPGQIAARPSTKRLDRFITLALALALGYFAFDKFVLDPARDESREASVRNQTRALARTASQDDHSVAVLPFVNMSNDDEQEYFADGLTEELLNLLAHIPDLRVTARTSSFFFKGRDLPIPEIAEALNVRHILEGSVRRSGNQLRITAQLIDAQTDAHLWSETYDRELKDLFQTQDEVASAIADALLGSFDGLEIKPVSRTDSLAAFEAFRTGRLHWWRRSPQDLNAAIGLFTEAIGYDPNFAPAYAAIADSWLLLVEYGEEQILEARDKALPMIEKALALDPDSAQAYAAMGLSQMRLDEKKEAETSLRKAISLDEQYIPAYLWLGNLLGAAGRVAEQGSVLQGALKRDPLNEILAVSYAENLSLRGDYEGAKRAIEGLLRMRPDFPVVLTSLSQLALENGDLVTSWQSAHQAYSLQPDNTLVIINLAKTLIGLEEYADAETLLVSSIEQYRRNVDLKMTYLTLLLIQERTDDAQALIDRLFGANVEALPEGIQRVWNYEMALLSAIRKDYPATLGYFENSVNPDESQLFDNNQIISLSIAAMLYRDGGQPELAEARLQTAERTVGLARVNGIDNARIYYSAACLSAMRGEVTRSLQTLQQAYEKGFRMSWLLDRDGRLDALRDTPEFEAIRQRINEDLAQAREAVARL